jgi:type II secretory pathway predicted ATPase ExeA
MSNRLQALYGLKWNPFSPELPLEALYVPPKVENFCWRIENAHVREGGFAMVHGDPGTGKSVVMRLLAERLERLTDLTVVSINHPQSNLADFYREMGDIFGIELKPHNRWGGFKTLRDRWFGHLESTRRRPILLIDEAQEMSPAVLGELRLMASARFDSQPLLCVVLAGDSRLTDKLRRDELIPLGSRIRSRLATEKASPDELLACLDHLLGSAGAPRAHHAGRRTARDGLAARLATPRREAVLRRVRFERTQHTSRACASNPGSKLICPAKIASPGLQPSNLHH